MKTIPELTKYIRFQLSQLRSQNKHHEFEHLTRQFARLRICENILPATGPVSSGGDQGRDFEAYRTYLESTPITASTFLGTSKDKKLVFACTLQQDDISAKIKTDISMICGSAEHVDTVYYFCEVDVPVAKRHVLQDWARTTFDLQLEILDGQALSEQLTSLDVFWIAEEYLDVSSELYPRLAATSKTYDLYKQRWLTENKIPYLYSDFTQVKYGLRRATFDADAKPDLSRWSKKMEVFLDETYPADLQRRAIYEICVAALRGFNNLTDRKSLVEQYFSHIELLDRISDIEDATTLLSYCSSAYLHRHFDISTEALYKWSKSLIARIEKALEEIAGPGVRCRLLQIRGQAGWLPFQKGTIPDISLKETFNWWFRLLDEVVKAPLFPLENFADMLTVMTEVVGTDDDFIKLTRRTDDLLTTRSSGYVAAEKCRDRAMAFYDSGQYLQAIKQLHQAKIKWFTAETLRGSLLSMLILSDCYQQLGLIYPAKYYASGVAYISHQQTDDNIKVLIPKALFQLADCCYLAGEWLTYGHVVQIALMAHHLYDEEPLNEVKHENLKAVFVHTAIIRTLTKRFDKSLRTAFDEVFSRWPIDPETREVVEGISVDNDSYWNSVQLADFWNSAQEELSGRPFSDMGLTREIKWTALGVDWTVELENHHLLCCISEEVVSTLQIILADLASYDLILLPTKVLINIEIINGEKANITDVPNNTVATWRIGFPRKWINNQDAADQSRAQILGLASAILFKCSMLTTQKFNSMIEKAFSEGLPAKVFSARSYSELYAEFMPEKDFYSPDRTKLDVLEPSLSFNTIEHQQLHWMDWDGPGYSKEIAHTFITNRYKNTMKSIKYTLPRLLKDPHFRSLIHNLRYHGFLDWEILVLVANISADYRLNQKIPQTAPEEEKMMFSKELMFREERMDDFEIPTTIFTKDKIKIYRHILNAVVAKTWGLELHLRTPDLDALEKLLDKRYHNSEDDIEHGDIFGSLCDFGGL